MKKTIIVLGLIYLIQFTISCIPCDCNPPQTFEIIYYDITVTAYNTAGYQNNIVEDTIYKNAFGLTVTVDFDLITIAKLMNPKGKAGFNIATAWSCSCVEDKFEYTDPIDRIEIFVIDPKTQETVEITNNFAIYEYSKEELISLEEFFNNREDWHDGFQFELVEFELIPNSTVFRVDIYLESGTRFTKETDQINFYLKKSA